MCLQAFVRKQTADAEFETSSCIKSGLYLLFHPTCNIIHLGIKKINASLTKVKDSSLGIRYGVKELGLSGNLRSHHDDRIKEPSVFWVPKQEEFKKNG